AEARTPGALHARLEEEARTLFAFYVYGALHGGVRVRNRAQDEHLLPVSWSMAGDSQLHAMVKAAESWWSPVELVPGEPPQLDDPWKGARRAEIVEDYWPTLYICENDDVRAISAHDIFAIRLLDDRATASVEPRLHHRWDERVCVIKVTLDGIEPPIWRRLVVSASNTLERLHAILQAALGWTNSHLHVFEVEDERIGTPYELDDLHAIYTRSDRIIHVGDLVDRGVTRFAYTYDFGDGWRHTVEIEEVQARDHGSSLRCTAGARACPPEDCGGVGGYERLLEALFDPRHEQFAELRAWVGPGFEPERFDLREVNDRLATVGWRGYDGGLE
ncbi:MAG: plasmid pRiA4b ORF-3 family protein, partial [Bacteroidales bacterium]